MPEKSIKLDARDRKILYELEVNARRSNREIGRRVGLSKETVKYRIDRLLANGTILRFSTITNYFKLGIAKYKLYLKLRNADKAKIDEICRYFHSHRKTEWVAHTAGEWDIIVGFLVYNINELDEEIENAMNRFHEFIQGKAVTTTLYIAHHVREFLNKEGKIGKEIVYHTSADPKESVDETDMKILRAITNNARMPVKRIAELIGVSPRIVHYRLSQLEKNGVILAYKTQIDPKKMGNGFFKAIVYLASTKKKRLDEFVNYCGAVEEIVWPQRVMGAWDMELDFEVESYEKFYDRMLGIKEKFSDIVQDYGFCIMMNEYKLDFFPGAMREMQ